MQIHDYLYTTCIHIYVATAYRIYVYIKCMHFSLFFYSDKKEQFYYYTKYTHCLLYMKIIFKSFQLKLYVMSITL